jgi:hypothetical protein
MRTKKSKFLLILVMAVALVGLVVPTQAAVWDSTRVYYATTVTKYDVAVGDKLKGASDDTVRILTTENATPFKVYLFTDRSTALPMSWVTETIYTDTYGNRGCAIGDVDGDGQNEIIIGRTSSPYGLRMIKWTGGAWVTTVILTSTSSYVGAIYDIAIGDADNNPATANDIVFNTGSYGVMKARWNGATFDTTRLCYSSTNSYFYGVAIGDFDAAYAGNEIVAVTYGQRVFRIKFNGATWDTATIYYTATDYDFYDVAVGDFDASNPGAEIAINNGYSSANAGVYELYGSGASWTFAARYVPGSGWSSNGEIAVGDFYGGNAGDEIVAVSGSGSAYEARLVYGSGTTWYNEKIMGTGGSYDYGLAIGDLNRYRPGNELAVGGYYKVWEAEEHIMADNMATISINNPTAGAVLQGNSSISIQATVQNTATNTQNQVPVNLTITDGVSYTYTDVETTGTLTQGQTQQMIFSPDWTVPNNFAGYTIKVWTALSGDEYWPDDTLTISVTAIPQGYTMESFEGTLFPPAGWAMGPGTTDWARTSGSAHSGSYKARASGQNAWLFTPWLSAGTGDSIKFWYRAESATQPTSFYVRLSTNSYQTDTSAYTTILADYANITSTTYLQGAIDLSPYKGAVYIAFHRYYGSSSSYYLFLDDVAYPPIYVPANDMATISIDDLPGLIETGSDVTIKATVQNQAGQTANAGVPVKLKIEGPLGYVYTDAEATTINLDPDSTEQIAFVPDWHAPDTLCSYTITVWTELSGDEKPVNDTLSQQATVYRAGGLVESFTGLTFPPPGWTVYNFFTTADDAWSRYTVYYNSAPACARIYYDVPNNDWLITPRLRVVTGDELRFWWRTQSTSYTETLFVRVSTNPDVSDTGSYLLIDQVSSTGNISWFNKQIDLSGYAGQDIYIAFFYRANNTYGMAIDDVTGPYFPPKIKVTPDSIYVESFPDSFFDIFFNISNIGGGTLNYTNSLSSLKSWLTVHPTSGSLASGEQDEDTLSFNTTGMDGHYYDTLVITSNSGEKATNLVPIHIWVRLIPDISVSPDSFAVGVDGNSTKDTAMFISNSGNGNLEYTVETEEWSKFGVIWDGEPATRPHRVEMTESEARELLSKGGEDPRRGTPPAKGQGGPDAFGYRWIDSDEAGGPIFNWIEINSIGNLLSITDDGNVGPFAIGFPFEFYGVSFDSFRVASNGFATFTSTVGNLTNDTIPNPPEPNNLLALMWDDLRSAYGGGAGNIYYHSNSERLVIEYDHVIRYGQTNCPYTMEIILYPNGKIIYQYLQMGDGTCTYLNQSTIGIENGTGTDGLEVVFNANYVHDNLAIRFSAAPAWLVFSPEIGTVPPSETDTIDVTFDATGILSGDFYGAFIINSNDPDTPVDTVPAHMHILVPDMTFTPASIETSGTEGQAPFDVTMDIGNAGEGRLIFSIVEGIPWLSVSPVADTIPSGDPASTITLSIDCTSLYAGNYVGHLKVYSNDPDFQPYATYDVALHVGPNPDIAVNPESFDVGIYAGYTHDTTMTISNTGDGHLVWGTAIEELGKGADTTLYEGFEGTFPPADWLVVNHDGGTVTWEQTTTYYHTGTHSASCRWESTTLWNDDWLITPRISIGSNDSLSFWYRAYSATWPESLEVRLSTTTNDVSAFTTLLWAGSQLVNTTWEEQKIELGKYSRGQVYIAFVYKGLNEFRIFVDDVLVQSFAGPWLVVDPLSGITNPHSNTGVKLSFSSIGYENDMYANLWITSNDPDESPILVPVHMAILGPNYSVSPPETLVIDALEDQYTDGHVFMQNYGGHAPLAYKMTDEVTWLSESPDTAEVPIDGAQDVTVTVDGNLLIAGDYETNLFIKTNDFDTPNDTLVVIVHVGPPPAISVDPDTLDPVQVLAGGTKDTTITISNTGDGHLSFEITTEETGPKLAAGDADRRRERVNEILESNKYDYSSSPAGAGFAGINPEYIANGTPTPPGSPVEAKGETLFIQLPHDPSESWSFGTSDAGAGYKMHENFWDVTDPTGSTYWWGLCLKYVSGAWQAGNPNNLVFDVTFYSDPPDDHTLPTDVACTYEDVVPTVVPTGIYYTTGAGTFEMYFFEFPEMSPICDLPEGWVSIQSQSAGTGYDWFLWASAKTGDGFSYQQGASTPGTLYDRAMILISGGAAWLSVTPEADTVDPQSSVNVTVHFDATDVLGGEKFGNIIIEHNAPGKGTTIVPVHMVVGGAMYAIDPQSLDIEALEDQYTNAYLTISNPAGQGPLSYKMTCPVSWLLVNPDSAQILPDSQLSVVVRVNGYELIAGDYVTEIAVKTNAVNQQYDTIPVTVHVGPDAEVDIAPMSLDVAIIPGHNKVETLKVNNLGGGHLGFVTEIEGAKGFFKASGRGTTPAKLPPADAVVGKDGSLAGSIPTPTSRPNLSFGGDLPKQDVILSEGFEDGWPPPGWTVIQNSTDNTHPIPCWWSQTSYSVYSGAYAAGLWWSYYYQDEWLITPEITLPAGPCTLSFWTYGWEGSTYNDHYYVKVSTDGGSNWTVVFDLSTLPGGTWNQWQYPYYIDLTPFGGQNVKIAWHAEDPPSDDGLWYLWIIDEITLTSYGPGCPFTATPEADTLDPGTFIDLLVTFDGSAFEAASLETLRCNLLFYTNDPDEALVTVPVTMWSLRGDVDDDGVINVVDVVFLLNYLFIDGPEPIPMEAGDLDYDLDVDSDDVLYLISCLFLGGPPPEMPLAPSR